MARNDPLAGDRAMATGPSSDLSEARGADAPVAEARVAPLRGAAVQIDGRRVVVVVVGIVLVALVILVVVFTAIGVHKNRQIDQLHDRGVAVTVTITSCQGLLGGSGSNGAGYSCRGTYELGGRRYNELLPGTALHAPGTTIPSVAVPGDPALISPKSIVDSEHSSNSVYILPGLLLLVLVAIVGVLAVRARKVPRRGSASG
jgi:hypothetical protein